MKGFELRVYRDLCTANVLCSDLSPPHICAVKIATALKSNDDDDDNEL